MYITSKQWAGIISRRRRPLENVHLDERKIKLIIIIKTLPNLDVLAREKDIPVPRYLSKA